jgi:ATPase subunit of ABC transporter with duplicated ATPase domains
LQKRAALEVEAKHAALFDKKLAQEEVWIRQGVEARRTRNEGRVRALEQLRRQRRERRERIGTVELRAQDASPSGKLVFEAKHVTHAFGAAPVIRDFSARIQRHDRIGIIGPNGCGKSTLIKLLVGELEPTSGLIKRGTNLLPAYFDQQREQLNPNASIMDNVTGGSGDTVTIDGQPRHVSGYLRDFLFPPERLHAPVSMLSGGERNRLLLARLFSRPSNLLVMDEPTNDLDAETLELLEELVADYAGTLLLVSHDRAFLDNVVTSTLVFEGAGQINEYVGGYTDWLRQRKVAAAANASAAPSAAAPSAAAASATSASAAAPSAAAASATSASAAAPRAGAAGAAAASATAASAAAASANAASATAPSASAATAAAANGPGASLKASAPLPAKTVTPKPKRLSYNEQRELAQLPEKIQLLEAEQAQLNARISDPAAFQRNKDESNLALQRLRALAAELETAYSRWDSLDSSASPATRA